jgi:hypothetical protein
MQEGDGSECPERETQIGTSLFSLLESWLQRKSCSRRGRASCTRCKGVHHRSICNDEGTTTTPTTETTSTTVGKIDVVSPNFTYLQTARIWVMGPSGLKKLTRCVLDGGSQSSFISKNLVNDLKLEVVNCRDLVVTAFESRSPQSGTCRVVRFCANSIWVNITVTLTAFENNHVFCPQPTVPQFTNIAQTRKYN